MDRLTVVNSPPPSSDAAPRPWGPEDQALWDEAGAILRQLYGATEGAERWLDDLQARIRAWRDRRGADLVRLDATRGQSAQWLQEGRQVGYSFYVDRFAGDLAGVQTQIPYLEELGVTYVHPLPLLRARDGDSDGGFAVADFREVEPALGSMDDLRRLAAALHQRDMALVLDVVCNHTAAEHDWARAARRGEARYRDYYHVLDSRDEVDAYEAHLTDVFPDTAPGSFTWSEDLNGWVWTTFREFQWDLNYANPAVFAEMLDVLCFLVDAGVDGFRLDSTTFLWKRLGTACRNQPECHLILQAWRALISIVAPSVVFKAEAIEDIDAVLPFFGSETSPECDLAYSNSVMAATWAALALESTAPAAAVIGAAAAKPPRASWLNYVRCHDDLIWSVLSPALASERQREVASFFNGETSGSFSAGRAFQTLGDGVPSTNGMAASLCGLGDDIHGEARLLLLYSVCFALDGVPTIYMGDEIGLGNDENFSHAPDQAFDGRWLHRPAMDWSRAERRSSESVEGRLFRQFARLARLRAALPAMNAAFPALPLQLGVPSVLAFTRGEQDRLLCVANFSPRSQTLNGADLAIGGAWRDLLADETGAQAVALGPYQVRWIVESR